MSSLVLMNRITDDAAGGARNPKVSPMWQLILLGTLCPPLLALGGCVAMARPALQQISAGYTGCLPADNQISNVDDALIGATWNATCKGKVYLCSSAQNADHCAPVAQ
jgi:hypothetical protein